MSEKCPVDHTDPEVVARYRRIAESGGLQTPSADGSGTQNINAHVASKTAASTAPTAAPTDACPVDHTNPEIVKKYLDHANGGEGLPPLANVPSQLSDSREISSIPKAGGQSNWVYPSEQQFYSAMKRKNFDPSARDMPVVIPIHNAVNERTWAEVLRWEQLRNGGDSRVCGGPQLLSFKGDSKRLTPKAWLNMWFGGSQRPFDRHDWTVSSCGVPVDYVIDFYSGQPDREHPERQSFYLDVRPKLNSWEGLRLRWWGWWS